MVDAPSLQKKGKNADNSVFWRTCDSPAYKKLLQNKIKRSVIKKKPWSIKI
jgi:hypothetical protein